MYEKCYFQKVKEETSTRFWINNPTVAQAKDAIEAGAVGCTTNPSYVSKLFTSQEDFNFIKRTIDVLIPVIRDDSVLAAVVQRMAVYRISELFMPLYEDSDGKEGFVTIQGDPFAEKSYESIIEDGIENRKIGKNVMIKIPVTEAGIKAIEAMVKMNIPAMATEVMGLSQAISICDAYKAISIKTGNKPAFFVTHITGILDDYFKSKIKEKDIVISEEAVRWAGLSIAKREYAMIKEKKYEGSMIGGGARKLEDFTELVGGDINITINWKGTAEALIEKDPPVVSRIDEPVPDEVIEELMENLPDYSRAYNYDGMSPHEYYDYGGVELFRSSFMKGWKQLLALIKDRRELNNADN